MELFDGLVSHIPVCSWFSPVPLPACGQRYNSAIAPIHTTRNTDNDSDLCS